METIYDDKQKSITITIDTTYNPAFLKLAEDTQWGTEGIIYKMNNLEAEFKEFKKALYVSLKENDETLAICIANQKQTYQNNATFDTFYICVLAVNREKMGKGYGSLILNTTTEYIFSKFDKVLVYAYVEEDNKASRKVMKKANFRQIASFIAPSYVSFNPKNDKNVIKLTATDEPQLLKLINTQYKDHSFIDINSSLDPDSYYILKENNEIKAGLQVKILSWTFISLAGFEGFLMMHIVPALPFLKNIFNPKNQSFLKVGNIFFNNKADFRKLLDSMMCLYKIKTSLAYANPKSPVDLNIISEMKKGILSSTDSKVLMFYRSQNISLDELNPQFLSIADSI